MTPAGVRLEDIPPHRTKGRPPGPTAAATRDRSCETTSTSTCGQHRAAPAPPTCTQRRRQRPRTPVWPGRRRRRRLAAWSCGRPLDLSLRGLEQSHDPIEGGLVIDGRRQALRCSSALDQPAGVGRHECPVDRRRSYARTSDQRRRYWPPMRTLGSCPLTIRLRTVRPLTFQRSATCCRGTSGASPSSAVALSTNVSVADFFP